MGADILFESDDTFHGWVNETEYSLRLRHHFNLLRCCEQIYPRGALQYQTGYGCKAHEKAGAFGENTVSKMRSHWVRSQILVQN